MDNGLTSPLPNHTTNSTRNAFESELWLDMALSIYASNDPAEVLNIPMRVAGRLQITAHAQLNSGIGAGGTLAIIVDGINLIPGSNVPYDGTCIAHGYIDLSPGTHTVAITSSVTITACAFTVRCGRIPTTV